MDKDKKSMKHKENKNYYYELLDFFNENEKLKLTNNNATFIEAVLKIDSRYKDSGNLNKYPSKEYIDYLKYGDINIYDDKIHEYGSGKYWINKLVIIIESNNIDYEIAEKNLKYEKKSNNTEENEIIDSLNLETVIKGTVCAIDRENSTHLTAHHSTSKVGRSNVSKIIYEEMKKGLEEFKNKLLEDDNFPLIGLITVPKEKDKENYHYSFATKFCKYLSLGFEKDKYYIYDNIIISNIDYYIKKYNLNEDEYNMKSLKFEKNDYTKDNKEIKCIKISEKYKKLWICLEEIRKRAKKECGDKKLIARDELDHIIWYSNK